LSPRPPSSPKRRPVEGIVPRANVLSVLRANGVEVTNSGAHQYILTKGGRIEVQIFPPMVHRRMLHRLARILEVPIQLLLLHSQPPHSA
jgi:hypothetical protein